MSSHYVSLWFFDEHPVNIREGVFPWMYSINIYIYSTHTQKPLHLWISLFHCLDSFRSGQRPLVTRLCGLTAWKDRLPSWNSNVFCRVSIDDWSLQNGNTKWYHLNLCQFDVWLCLIIILTKNEHTLECHGISIISEAQPRHMGPMSRSRIPGVAVNWGFHPFGATCWLLVLDSRVFPVGQTTADTWLTRWGSLS